MPLFDDSTWRREEWYESDELSHPFWGRYDGAIDAVIYLGRATGVVPAVWLYLIFLAVGYVLCFGFEVAAAVDGGHRMFSQPMIYAIPPVAALVFLIGFDRKALWRRRD